MLSFCIFMAQVKRQRNLGGFMLSFFSRVMTVVFLVTGCSSIGSISNDPISKVNQPNRYSLASFKNKFSEGDVSVSLAFSGGGIRASALSYGVLKALKNTRIKTAEDTKDLLSEVDTISAVSGGSFTAAYYGLHGDKIFPNFESVFLRRDFQTTQIKSLLNPANWFSFKGRSERAIQLYQKNIFKGATFRDMQRPDAPLIIINASDLAYGVRFSFIQEYFDLICSDLSSFPVARAVAASASVPIIFNPVVMKNHDSCKQSQNKWFKEARVRAEKNSSLVDIIGGLENYTDKERTLYSHFVDGGITDNLGLRAITDIIEASGGANALYNTLKLHPPRRLIMVSVNAATNPDKIMTKSKKQPGILQTVNAMSDVQLHRYNIATTVFIEGKIKEWAKQLSTPQRPVEAYFINLSIAKIKKASTRQYLNSIPTSFSLSEKQVNTLISAGEYLLQNNSEYKRLLKDIAKDKPLIGINKSLIK